MRKILIFLVFIASILSANGQKSMGVLKGKLINTAAKQPLSDAAVSILHVNDSSIFTFVLTDKQGGFEIKDIDPGNYFVLITYQGLQTFEKKFSIENDKKIIDLGVIQMEKEYKTLEGVVVTAQPPIQIKGDTVQFRADAFKTKANATAEDLLKKLPGVQVDKDGNVKAQGEDVQKVYVDGKEFFGTDPKLAIKNITADMIESVQVFDDMGEQAKFTRIDDGTRSKTINIKLRKDKRKGYFGRAVAGVGTEGLYESNLSFNRFNDDQRISIIGNFNYLNRQGFSSSDIVTSMGGFGSGGGGGGNRGGGGFGGGGFGGGGGITKSLSTGINYSDEWGTKENVTGSYFYSNTDTRSERSSLRQSFFANDSVTFQNQQSLSHNKNQNHRANLKMEFYIDSMNSILYTPTFSKQQSQSESRDSIDTRATKPGLDYLALQGLTKNDNERGGISVNNNLLYRRKFKKTGRTLTLGWNNSLNNSNGQGINYAPYIFYNTDSSLARINNQDLKTFQKTRSLKNVISSSYTELIGKNKLLELNYAYTNNQSTSDRSVFDFNPVTNEYDKVNSTQTNYFENGSILHRAGTNFRVQAAKYNFQLGLGAQYSDLKSYSKRKRVNNTDTIVDISHSFLNFFPTANFNYTLAKSKNLRFSFRGRTTQPGILQLQDVPDYTNPLYVRTGNPALKEEFNSNFNLSYNSFNSTTFRYTNFNIQFDNTANKIANRIDTLGRGIQLVKPVNMNGAFRSSASVNFGLPLKGKMKGSSINFNSSVNLNRDLSMLNKQESRVNNMILTQSANINLDFKETLNMGLNASLSYNNASYSVQKNLNADYLSQTYSADINYTAFKNLVLSTDFDYYLSTGREEGYNQNIPLWNAGIARQLFKKKNGEIKFNVHDILNQNESITRSVGDNYITDSRTMVLQRYFMLTFTYNLNRAGAGNQMRNQGPGQFQRRGNS